MKFISSRVLLVIPALCASLIAACGGGGSDVVAQPIPPAPASACSANGVAASNASLFPTVCMLTTQGEIVVELYPAQAPVTVANFLKYVNGNLYDNTLYHRVIAGFVNQGGGFTTAGNRVAEFAPIALESNNGLSNLRGTLAMARSSLPNSATSEFYVNSVNNSNCLDFGKVSCDPTGKGYAVFGKVIFGLDVMDRISVVAADVNGLPFQRVVTYWARQLK